MFRLPLWHKAVLRFSGEIDSFALERTRVEFAVLPAANEPKFISFGSIALTRSLSRRPPNGLKLVLTVFLVKCRLSFFEQQHPAFASGPVAEQFALVPAFGFQRFAGPQERLAEFLDAFQAALVGSVAHILAAIPMLSNCQKCTSSVGALGL